MVLSIAISPVPMTVVAVVVGRWMMTVAVVVVVLLWWSLIQLVMPDDAPVVLAEFLFITEAPKLLWRVRETVVAR